MINWFNHPRRPLCALLVANLAVLIPFIFFSAIGPYIQTRYIWDYAAWPPEFNIDLFIRKIFIGTSLCAAGSVLVALPTIYVTRKDKITDIDLFLSAMFFFTVIFALPVAVLFAMYAQQAPFGIAAILGAILIFSVFLIPATIAALVYWLNTEGNTTDQKAKRNLKFFYCIYITLITFSEIAGQWD